MDESKSKSQKKREADAMQKMGVDLIQLPSHQLNKFPLSNELYRAIEDAKTLKSHGAIRRQAQLIGKLMRRNDYDAILAVYNEILADKNAQTGKFHELEQWREQLITHGKEALTAFIQAYPSVDIQQLRHLIAKAAAEKMLEKSGGAHKALFQFLRSFLS